MDLEVNFLECWERRPNGREKRFSWVTDLRVDRWNAMELMRAGRARWRVENETFNTLKNQGCEFEHNFSHGRRHLATVFAALMLLAFSASTSCGRRAVRCSRRRWRARGGRSTSGRTSARCSRPTACPTGRRTTAPWPSATGSGAARHLLAPEPGRKPLGPPGSSRKRHRRPRHPEAPEGSVCPSFPRRARQTAPANPAPLSGNICVSASRHQLEQLAEYRAMARHGLVPLCSDWPAHPLPPPMCCPLASCLCAQF